MQKSKNWRGFCFTAKKENSFQGREIFKGEGGIDESNRLDVPLLSKIPINSDLALYTDKGTPYVKEHKNTYIRECYENIAQEIINKFL